MSGSLKNRWANRLAALATWLLVCASALYWGLRLTAAPAKSMAATVSAPPPVQADPLAVARILGAQGAPISTPLIASLSSRLLLLGVIADTSGTGAALIAVDGKPAKPFRVGREVSDGYALQSVQSRAATLAQSGGSSATITLEMAPQKK